MNKKEIKEKLSEGYIQFNALIEIVGKPKNHVEESIKTYVDNIDENEHYHLTKKIIEKAEETDDGFFSTYAEVEILTKELPGVTAFCFNYMPASIEIIEPSELVYNNVMLTDMLNELQAKLHEVDMVAKQSNQKNLHLNENINALVTNFVIFSCSVPRTPKDIADITGLKKDVIEPFLKGLVDNGKLKKEKDKYRA